LKIGNLQNSFFSKKIISHFGDISTSEKNGSAKAQNTTGPIPLGLL